MKKGQVKSCDEDVYYQCQRCGNCCRWPGDVCFDEDEIAPVARFVGLSEEGFIQQYMRLRTDRKGLSLIEKPNNECIFLEGNVCLIQPVKPRQCKGFPNEWNFPGWRNECEAIPVPRKPEPDQSTS